MTEPLLVDAACAERGCACYDHRDGPAPVEMVPKKEWVGLTGEEIEAAWVEMCGPQRWAMHSVYARKLEAKLKEKNT